MRLYFPLPPAVFWVLIITAISVILFQIVRIPQPAYEPLLLVEILILGITLHMIHIIPFYGMPTTDSLRCMWIVNETVEHGIVTPDRPEAAGVAAWPLSLIWGAELHHITGITIRSIALWIPSLVLSGAFVLILYILIKRVFESKQVALLAMLLMITVPKFTLAGATFKPEALALVMMMAGLYLLAGARGRNGTGFAVLSILCFLGVIFCHHLTPLTLLLFCVVYWVINWISISLGKNWLPSPRKTTITVTATFTLLMFVGVFAYSMYVNDTVLSALTATGKALLYPESGMVAETVAGTTETVAGTTETVTGTAGPIVEAPRTLAETSYVLNPADIITVRGRMTFWGRYFFFAVFATILLLGFFTRPKEKPPEFYSFASLLFVYGVWALIQLYVLPATAAQIASMERWVMLGWIWGAAPLAMCVWGSTRRWGKQVGIVILAMYMLFNIYTLPRMKWDLDELGRAEGQITLKEDHALAETIAFTGEVATFKFTRNAIYDVQGYYATDFRQVDFAHLEDLDSLVIKKGELESYMGGYYRLTAVGRPFDYTIAQLNQLQELLTDSSSGDRNRIYDSNNLVVLK